MSPWWPDIVTHRDATKVTRMGRYGALGLAAWLGFPALIGLAFGSVQKGFVSAIEILVVALLVGLSLFGAKRFTDGQGARIGAILLVVLVLEVAKRIVVMFSGTLSFGIIDAVVTFMIFFGLMNGVRAARALHHLTPDEGLRDVFE